MAAGTGPFPTCSVPAPQPPAPAGAALPEGFQSQALVKLLGCGIGAGAASAAGLKLVRLRGREAGRHQHRHPKHCCTAACPRSYPLSPAPPLAPTLQLADAGQLNSPAAQRLQLGLMGFSAGGELWAGCCALEAGSGSKHS